MRLFVAIDIPEDLRGRVAELQQKLVETKANIRWVDPKNFHITLKFLGETDEKLVSELSARLERAAGEVVPPLLQVDGVDRLPERGQARVIICPIVNPDQRVTKLHRLVDSAVGGLGLPLDTRVLVPHLTLGRVNNNHNLNKLLRLMEKHAFDPLGSFEARQVTLYLSTMGPGGSVYSKLHTAGLANPQTTVHR